MTYHQAKEQIDMLLERYDPPSILRIIMSETCPRRQENMLVALNNSWQELEDSYDERAITEDDVTCYIPKWPERTATIDRLLNRVRKKISTTTNLSTLHTTPLTQTSTPMSIIINKLEGTFHQQTYNQCTFINGNPATQHPSYATQMPHQDIQDVTPVKEASAATPYSIDLERFEEYLNIRFCQNNPAYQEVVNMLCCQDYSDRERAYFAYKLHTTNHILKPILRPNTFKAWYRIMCDIFTWDFHDDYTPTKILPPSEKAQKIDEYIKMPIPKK